MTIGLADWHIYEIGKGHKTALRQTQANLFLILVRPDSVEWRRYADIHGMILQSTGLASSIEDAITLVMRSPLRPNAFVPFDEPSAPYRELDVDGSVTDHWL